MTQQQETRMLSALDDIFTDFIAAWNRVQRFHALNRAHGRALQFPVSQMIRMGRWYDAAARNAGGDHGQS